MSYSVQDELKFESDLPYEVLNGRLGSWNFGKGGFEYLNVSDVLAKTMLENPQLKVFFGSGRMDLATPYFSSAGLHDFTFGLAAGVAEEYFAHVLSGRAHGVPRCRIAPATARGRGGVYGGGDFCGWGGEIVRQCGDACVVAGCVAVAGTSRKLRTVAVICL